MSQDGQDSSTGSGTGPDGNDGNDAVGTVADEAVKLMGALADWARDQGSGVADGVAGLTGHAARAARGVDSHLDTGAAECTYCPVCRTVHALRQTSPEVRAQLATAATSLLQAASGLLATAVPDARPDRGGVEHIDLDDEPQDWPEDPDDEPEERDR